MVDIVSLSQRIRKVRRALGETQADFGVHFDVDQSTVSKWELGRQIPESHHMDTFEELESQAGGDSNGSTPQSEGGRSPFTLVPVVGDIGAGAAVYPIEGDRSDRAIGYVRAARGFGAVEALRIKGDSMYPAYRDGDLVFIENRLADFPLNRDTDYIIEAEDGRVLLKMVELNQDGSYNLIPYNGAPERNVRIRTARQVRYVRKA